MDAQVRWDSVHSRGLFRLSSLDGEASCVGGAEYLIIKEHTIGQIHAIVGARTTCRVDFTLIFGDQDFLVLTFTHFQTTHIALLKFITKVYLHQSRISRDLIVAIGVVLPHVIKQNIFIRTFLSIIEDRCDANGNECETDNHLPSHIGSFRRLNGR